MRSQSSCAESESLHDKCSATNSFVIHRHVLVNIWNPELGLAFVNAVEVELLRVLWFMFYVGFKQSNRCPI